MIPITSLRSATSGLLGLGLAVSGIAAAHGADRARVAEVVEAAIPPILAEHGVPGMAVAVLAGGERHYFNFGLDAPDAGKPVDETTLFELGSVSKTFTATLGAYAAARGRLSLADRPDRHLPELAGAPIAKADLLQLATYTAGGLPLQFPDDVSSEPASVLRYFREFRPEAEPGMVRRYSNPSIGLFGHIAGRAMGSGFAAAMTDEILPGFGLSHTYLQVPEGEMARYAWGAARSGQRIRVSAGALDGEAYGLKSSASDLARYLEAQIDPSRLEPALREAVEATQRGYVRVGPMVQGLGWERYPYPTSLDTLLTGNSTEMAREARPAKTLEPPLGTDGAVLFNKTGATAGFGAYLAFVPSKRIGIAMLANRNLPNAARIQAAHAILSALD